MARRRRNPAIGARINFPVKKVLVIGGAATVAYLLYSKFFGGTANAATMNPITGAITPMSVSVLPQAQVEASQNTVVGAAQTLANGVSNIFSGILGAVGLVGDVDKIKAYQKQLNALGAKLALDGIVGQKTLDANNKLMPMKYTSIALLKSAILGGVAGVSGLGNYILES